MTQHPTSLHPSISTRPTQSLLPFMSFHAGFILDRRPVSELGCNASPLVFLFIQRVLSLKHIPQTFPRCLSSPVIVFFLPPPSLPSLYFSQSLFSPPSTERYWRVFEAFVTQLTTIQKPLLACHRCDVVRRKCTRTNLSSVEPALRKPPFILR